MNVIREIEKINRRELESGIQGSWHDEYKHSAYIYVGGLSQQLTEGDVLCVFSQYGDIEDIDLVRDWETGKSKGFAFIKYADQRSTVLAVDNFNGAHILGRQLRVDHCKNYTKRQPRKNPDGSVNQNDLQELAELEKLKERALKYGEGLPDIEEDEGVEVDPYLKVKKEKDQKSKADAELEEQILDRLTKEMGLDKEDPMREYYLKKELKKLKRHRRKLRDTGDSEIDDDGGKHQRKRHKIPSQHSHHRSRSRLSDTGRSYSNRRE